MRILTLSQLSLAGSSGIAEVKQPIWFADGTTNGNSGTASASFWIADGGTSAAVGSSSVILFKTSSNWPITQKCAFEVTLYSGSSNTSYAALYDLTTPASPVQVSGSQVSTTSTSATVIRSSQFTLTPSKNYAISIWSSASGQYAYLIDASLIIFP